MDNLNVPKFMNSSDGLDVPKQQKSSVHVNYINKPATKKVAKRKISLVRVGALLGTAAIIGGIVVNAYNSHQYEQVLHKGDVYVDNEIHHTHELNKRNFVQDYKIVNENATEEDVLDAIYDGDYDYYLNHEGKVKIEKSLQGKEVDNDDVIDFSEQFLEEYGGKGSK